MFRSIANTQHRSARRIVASGWDIPFASRHFSSPSSKAPQFRRVYTHPLSKVVLEHLQKSHGDWVTRNGLCMVLNRDGTFCLRFPAKDGRIWTSFDSDKKQHWISAFIGDELVGRYPLHQGDGEACQSEKMNMRQTMDRIVERVSEASERKQAM